MAYTSSYLMISLKKLWILIRKIQSFCLFLNVNI